MKRTIKKKRYSKRISLKKTKKKYSRGKNTRKKRYSRKNKKTLSRKKKRYSKKRLVGGAVDKTENMTPAEIQGIIDRNNELEEWKAQAVTYFERLSLSNQEKDVEIQGLKEEVSEQTNAMEVSTYRIEELSIENTSLNEKLSAKDRELTNLRNTTRESEAEQREVRGDKGEDRDAYLMEEGDAVFLNELVRAEKVNDEGEGDISTNLMGFVVKNQVKAGDPVEVDFPGFVYQDIPSNDLRYANTNEATQYYQNKIKTMEAALKDTEIKRLAAMGEKEEEEKERRRVQRNLRFAEEAVGEAEERAGAAETRATEAVAAAAAAQSKVGNLEATIRDLSSQNASKEQTIRDLETNGAEVNSDASNQECPNELEVAYMKDELENLREENQSLRDGESAELQKKLKEQRNEDMKSLKRMFQNREKSTKDFLIQLDRVLTEINKATN